MNWRLLLIILIAVTLRLYGMNWDGGFHFHPDERMIIMVADRIHFFDKLNPHFFNYGSLPIYLLKGSAQLNDYLFSTRTSTYQGMLDVGRTWSILFDLGTVFFIYKIAYLLFRKNTIALFSSFIYAISFFPIQNAHFFTVDIMFTFFSTFLIYQLLLYVGTHSLRLIFFMGITFAALFATKFTAVIFLPAIFIVLLTHSQNKTIRHLLTFHVLSFIFYFLFMPYAFLDFSKFLADISLQLKMNKDPYIFPYTLQYVGTIPYFYYLKNIFLWGLGPITSILSFTGLFHLGLELLKKVSLQVNRRTWNMERGTILLIFYILSTLFYFLIIGVSAVKFMRYMLPLYPFFTLLAGVGLFYLKNRVLMIFSIFFMLIWSLLFMNMYSYENTRITATKWISQNVKSFSSLAVEHWDDYVPIYGGERYVFNELHLYDLPDNTTKWLRIEKQLQKSDYLIIASNRLYVPLQRLNDCNKYKSCYPKTAAYYKKLFNGQLGFKKIKEFSVRPGIRLGSFKFEINDESADESFTVFDHPKIMIFKKYEKN